MLWISLFRYSELGNCAGRTLKAAETHKVVDCWESVYFCFPLHYHDYLLVYLSQFWTLSVVMSFILISTLRRMAVSGTLYFI
jgi:hypothetical protein